MPIVSAPDPGDFHHPLQDGNSAKLLIDDLTAYDSARDPVGDTGYDFGNTAKDDPALSVEVTPELVAEQSRILDADVSALLAEAAHVREVESSTSCAEPAHSRADAARLPGFETLTETDLRLCPSWCIHQDLPVHSDGFDPDPDNAPHRSVEHTVRVIHGGENVDHTGRAEVSLQLEQDHDLSTGPTVSLSVVVRGEEQWAWLTLPETRALHQALGYLISEAEDGS